MSEASFFSELKRRNVLRAGVLYIGAIWALAQGISQLGPSIGLPDWSTRWFLVAGIVGFPFWLVFSWLYELTPHGFKRESEVPVDASLTRTTGRKLDFAIIGVLAVAVVLLLTDRFVARSSSAATSMVPDKSIAVLPFANTSGDAGNEYFSDGLSEELISSLSRLANLKVIGRTSSFQFKNKTDSSKTIGATLGVAYLLEGSVRKSADRVRIAVSLLKAADGINVWSESYDRDLKDIFAVQSEIADKVADRMKLAILGNAPAELLAQPLNQNLDAYTAVLQGNYHWRPFTVDGARKAIEYYEEAVRIDPNYGLAYAKLAYARVLIATVIGVEDAEIPEQLARARAAGAKALQLAPDLSETHQALGSLAANVDLDINEALRQYYIALQLTPQDSETLFTTGVREGMLGHVDKSIELGRRAVECDPISNVARFYYARSLIAAGRLDDAQAELRKSIELAPQAERNYMQLAVIEILRGNSAAAVALAKQEPNRLWGTFALALAYFANGEHRQADTKLQELIDHYASGGASQIAMVYALRQQPDKMFEWLDRGVASRDAGVLLLREDAFLAAYKNDPRFVAFGKKLGLPDLAAQP